MDGDIMVEVCVLVLAASLRYGRRLIIIADRPAACKGKGGKLGERKNSEGQMR